VTAGASCIRVVGAVAALLLTAVTPANAQVWIGSDRPVRGSVELAAGVFAASGFDLGTRDAEETRNINSGTGPFALFGSESRVGGAPGAQARLGVYLSSAVSFEAGVHYARPVLSSEVSGDAEGAPDLTIDETLTRYVVDGSIVLHLTQWSFAGGRGVPFVSGGGGYLRELHENNELVETGSEYHAGGGLKLWLGRAKRVGLRLDVAASSRRGGVDFGTGRRTVPSGGLSLAYLF
jgi:hypothetical protein